MTDKYVLRYTDKAISEFRKLDPTSARRVLHAIETKIAIDPDRFGKPLRYGLASLRSLRVGDWRVIYTKEGLILSILSVFHRSKGY